MRSGFGDEIMLLEGSGGTAFATKKDLVSAMADFPRSGAEELIGSKTRYQFEDGLDDVIFVKDALEGLERPPRPPRPRPRPHFRPRPYYPAPYYPIVTEPSILPVVAETIQDPLALQRIRKLEEKMAKLHPGIVKLLHDGIEGLGDITPTTNVEQAQVQIAAVRAAATRPGSSESKNIVKNLRTKADKLTQLSKDRREVAAKAIQDYQKQKKTVDRLERVARAKALTVVNAAIAGKTDPETSKRADKILDEVRGLHDRSVETGRKAVQSMKLYGVASMLAKNADAQAMVTKAASYAVEQGKPEEAKVLTAAIAKHSEAARALKATRQEQLKLWESENKEDTYQRLEARRIRFMKAISLLNQKAGAAGLSQEDQRTMRDAYAQLYRTEIAMQGLHGGRVIPAAVEQAKYGVSFEEFAQNPSFSVEAKPLPHAGTFVEEFAQGSAFSVEAKSLPHAGTFVQGLESSFIPHFSVEPEAADEVTAFLAAGAIAPGVSDLGATYVPMFSVEPVQQDEVIAMLAAGTIAPGVGDLNASYVPKFSVEPEPVDEVVAFLSAGVIAPGVGDASGLEKLALAWFSDAGDLVDDTPTSLSSFVKGLENCACCEGLEAFVDYKGKIRDNPRFKALTEEQKKIAIVIQDSMKNKDYSVQRRIAAEAEQRYPWLDRVLHMRGGKPRSLWSKLTKPFVSVARGIGKAATGVLKAGEKLASGAVNAVKTVASTSFNTLKNVAKGDLVNAAKALTKGAKGVAGEVWRQAKGVVNFVKSEFNTVCGMLSDSAIRTIGAAAAGAVSGVATGTGPAGATAGYQTANLGMKYAGKLCGAAGGVGKALAAIGHGDFGKALKTLAKTGKGMVNITDAIEATGISLPAGVKDAVSKATNVNQVANLLGKTLGAKELKAITQLVGAAPKIPFYGTAAADALPALSTQAAQDALALTQYKKRARAIQNVARSKVIGGSWRKRLVAATKPILSEKQIMDATSAAVAAAEAKFGDFAVTPTQAWKFAQRKATQERLGNMSLEATKEAKPLGKKRYKKGWRYAPIVYQRAVEMLDRWKGKTGLFHVIAVKQFKKEHPFATKVLVRMQKYPVYEARVRQHVAQMRLAAGLRRGGFFKRIGKSFRPLTPVSGLGAYRKIRTYHPTWEVPLGGDLEDTYKRLKYYAPIREATFGEYKKLKYYQPVREATFGADGFTGYGRQLMGILEGAAIAAPLLLT